MLLTIDASVWIASVLPTDKGHADSIALLNALRQRADVAVVLPTVVRPEVAGAVARRTGKSLVGERFAAKVVQLTFVRLVALTPNRADRSALLAATQRLRGADAVYAAVALEHGCDLVSLDNEHLTRLAGFVRTVTPAAALASLSPPSP